mgnify:CR=1 FL=1
MSKKSKKENEEIVEFSSIYKGSLGSDGRLTDYVNEIMVIEDVEFKEIDNYGEVAIVTVQLGREKLKLHTFSQVLMKQLKAIKEHTDKGKKVRARLTRRKRYYTFE